MTWWVKELAAKPEDLGVIPETHKLLGGEKWLLKVVL